MEENLRNFFEICRRRVDREELPDDPRKFEEICHYLQDTMGRLIREAAKDKVTINPQYRVGFEFQVITLVRDVIVNSTQAFVYIYDRNKQEILKEDKEETN